jgi:hypothetical protein
MLLKNPRVFCDKKNPAPFNPPSVTTILRRRRCGKEQSVTINNNAKPNHKHCHGMNPSFHDPPLHIDRQQTLAPCSLLRAPCWFRLCEFLQ